jgi:hypothetical protein
MSFLKLVDPGDLRLPSSRQDGPDSLRYARQVAKYGGSTANMPRILVTGGDNSELKINDGVTRALRVYVHSPSTPVEVEVMEVRSHADFSHLKRIRDIARHYGRKN